MSKPTSRRGGKRPGAGRKKLEPIPLPPCVGLSPVEFLLRTMNDEAVDGRLRVEAAKAVLPYLYEKAGTSKKATAQAKALTAHEDTEWEELLN